MSEETAMTILWLGLAFLCVAAGVGLIYMLIKLGRLLGSVDRTVHEVTDEIVPIINKAGVSVDTINVQLEKVDLMMDSAVDITQSVNTTVRAVSTAVAEPVKKVSGALAGVGEAASSFKDRVSRHDNGDATDTATPAATTDSGSKFEAGS